MKTIKYRGFEIRVTTYQGTIAYLVPRLGTEDLASNLATAKKWIDQWLMEEGHYAKIGS